jgi:hypothetical protein
VVFAWWYILCLRDLGQVGVQLDRCEKARSDFALRPPARIWIHIGNVLAFQGDMVLLILWPGGVYRASFVYQIMDCAFAIQHYHRAFTNL